MTRDLREIRVMLNLSGICGAEYRRPQRGMKAVWKPSKARSFQAKTVSAENDYAELWGTRATERKEREADALRDIANVKARQEEKDRLYKLMEEKRLGSNG